MATFSTLPGDQVPRIVRRQRKALCMDCGHPAWDGERCPNGHEPDHRVRLSTREVRALDYVRRGMPPGPFNPDYWPGVRPDDVATARYLWARWEQFHRVPPSTREEGGRNPLFE